MVQVAKNGPARAAELSADLGQCSPFLHESDHFELSTVDRPFALEFLAELFRRTADCGVLLVLLRLQGGLQGDMDREGFCEVGPCIS